MPKNMHYITRSMSTNPIAPSDSPAPASSDLLRELASRVRRLRRDRGWSRGELAGRSGLSVRFLARVEAGEGNISVLRLQSLARALETTPDVLVRPLVDPSRVVALVGLRGAGKSTVGPLLSQRLGVPFLELDELIQENSGLPLEQLFELHGEHYYRRLEGETVRRILARGEPAVVAAAGGIVNEPATWEQLLHAATVVWLRARPEDHWNRVIGQGDRRPMADHPHAMDELRALLSARERIYAESRWVVDTSERDAGDVADWIAARIENGDAD